MMYLNDLEKIININSYTKNKKGVDEVGTIMSKWIEELGFKLKTYNKEHIGNHLLFSSSKKSGKKILLLGHNDTVFPPNSFEGFSQDEKWVYGPGVCDMKGGNIVALQALRNIFNQNSEIYNIDFLLVSDEETGSDDSKEITALLAPNYDYCFVFEAAGINMEVVTQRKGVGTFIITIEGLASHAGNHYDKGIDANLEASYKLQELVKLTNLKLQTTVNVGKINGGIGANTISPKCELLLEIRYTTNDEKIRVLTALNRITNTSYITGTISTLSGSIQRDVMQENSKQLILIKELETITNSKILSEKRGGVSDANIVASCGVTTLDGFGPFGDGDHTIKERALKSSFNSRIELMTKILNHFQTNL
ncbi:M20 family metallopeptidase [bacterium]|nr:M20 family metallopeptidase [bacterium]